MKVILDERLMTINRLSQKVSGINRTDVYDMVNGLKNPNHTQRNKMLVAAGRSHMTLSKYWTLSNNVWFFRFTKSKHAIRKVSPPARLSSGISRSEWMKRRWASGEMKNYTSLMGPSAYKTAPKQNDIQKVEKLPTPETKLPTFVSPDVQQLSYKLISEQIRSTKDTVSEMIVRTYLAQGVIVALLVLIYLTVR